MKGDFSRIRFNPRKHYTSVLQQQGRVALDADANEQCSIIEYIRQTEATDIIGPVAGPSVMRVLTSPPAATRSRSARAAITWTEFSAKTNRFSITRSSRSCWTRIPRMPSCLPISPAD